MASSRLNELVSALLQSTRVEDSPQNYVEMLLEGGAGRNPQPLSQIDVQVAREKLSNKCEDSAALSHAVDTLTVKHGAAGSQFVNFTAKIADDKPLLVLVRSTRASHPGPIPTPSPSPMGHFSTPRAYDPAHMTRSRVDPSPLPSYAHVPTPNHAPTPSHTTPPLATPVSVQSSHSHLRSPPVSSIPRAASPVLSPETQQLLHEISSRGTPRSQHSPISLSDHPASSYVSPTVHDPAWTARKHQAHEVEPVPATPLRAGGALQSRRDSILPEPTPERQRPTVPRTHEPEPSPLGELPVAAQEKLLVQDLLFALVGIPGTRIKVRQDVPGFSLPQTGIERSLCELVNRILPLCDCYVAVGQYCAEASKYQSGMVAQALGACISTLVKEYLVMVSQLEQQHLKGSMTLQKMWFFVQPSLRTFKALNALITDIRDENERLLRAGEATVRGGQLLGLVHARSQAMAGDPQSTQILTHLLEKASVPFYEMLDLWAREGELRDPSGEFFVEERTGRSDLVDKNWHQRYVLRPKQCPAFLQRLQEKVLTCGKYVNVIHECKRDSLVRFEEAITDSKNEREFVEAIERVHRFNSEQLLHLVLNEYQLMNRLRSVKHYLLLDQGDFLVHFMDQAEPELQKPIHEISVAKLESLLDLAVRASTGSDDPFKEDLGCELLTQHLTAHLLHVNSIDRPEELRDTRASTDPITGLDGFALTYKVQWPLSLVLSGLAMAKYQLLFRHLFHVKQVERQISATWTAFQSMKEFKLGSAYTPLFLLRQRILHFLQNLQYYMAVEVLEPRWQAFTARAAQADSLDGIIAAHDEFLDSCINEFMLSEPHLLKILHKILTMCTIFADFTTKKLLVQSEAVMRSLAVDVSERRQSAGFSVEELRQTRIKAASEQAKQQGRDIRPVILKYQEEFNRAMFHLMHRLTERTRADPHLAHLLTRIDYNSYYLKQISQQRAQAARQ